MNRPLWEYSRRLAQEWTFRTVSSEGINDHLSGLISICLDKDEMHNIVTQWDGNAEALEGPDKISTPKPSEVSEHICSTVGVFGKSQDLVGISFWIARGALALSHKDKEGIQILGVFKSLAKALEQFKGPRSMLVGHPRLESIWADAGVYDLLEWCREVNELAQEKGLTIRTGGPELWDLFQGTVYEELSKDSGSTGDGAPTTEGENLMSGEETEVDGECHSCPARIFAYVTSRKGHRSTGTLLARQLKRAQSLGAFTSVDLGGKLLSWFYDPGTSITQMTPMEIARVGHVMELVSKGRVHYIFAEPNTSKVVKLYKAKRFHLLNPDTGAATTPMSTYVIENADLKVYPATGAGTQHTRRSGDLGTSSIWHDI